MQHNFIYISFYLFIMMIMSIQSFICKHRFKTFSITNENILRHTYKTSFSFNIKDDTHIITSETNNKIKLIKSLKLKKKRDEYQLIILEGHRVISDAISNKNIPEFIVYTEKSLLAPLSSRIKEQLDDISCDSYLISDNILKSLSDTVTNQGIIGVFPKPKQSLPLFNNDPKLLVILDNLSDPGNMGTLIRSSYGLGVDAIIVVNGCDVWSSKVLRSSMGCNLRIPILEWEWNEVNQYLQTLCTTTTTTNNNNCNNNNILQIIIADADQINTITYDKINYKLDSVIIIGSEAFGISNEALHLPGIIKKTCIPMTRNLESFNAAIAGSILLAEASKQRNID